jgi:hypothetical protein
MRDEVLYLRDIVDAADAFAGFFKTFRVRCFWVMRFFTSGSSSGSMY